MRIVLIGQAAFAAKVLERLVKRGDEVVALFSPEQVGESDPARQIAVARGIAVERHRSLKGPLPLGRLRDLAPDLVVLAYATQIVPPSLLEVPRLGSICFHPSLLPRYRGGSAINWQIIRGERETGVTVFWPDAGIDTGPILLQKRAKIGPDDSAGSLYYEKLFPLGVDAVVEAVGLVDAGRAPRIPQDESQASYDPLCRDEHARIPWDESTEVVRNLIRGCDPQPGAHTRWSGGELRVYAVGEARANAGLPPGTVVGIDPPRLVVATGDGAVTVARVRPGAEKAKLPAAEFAARVDLRRGARLG